MKWDNIRDVEYRTKEMIAYTTAHGRKMHIPAHTKAVLATNLPNSETDPRYWAEPWENMTEMEESWMRNYGFLIERDEVETC